MRVAQLTLLDRVHQGDALEGDTGGGAGLKAEQRPNEPFERSMVLCDHVV